LSSLPSLSPWNLEEKKYFNFELQDFKNIPLIKSKNSKHLLFNAYQQATY
jgi:hypothetical protein